MDGRISSCFGPSFSIWIGLVRLECVVGPFLSSGRAERPTIIDLLRQSCGRGYDSCRWGRRSGGVICLEKNLNRNLVGFAFCCSRLGEVLCNFTSGDREEVWKSFEIGGGALPLGYFFQSWESLYFLVSAIFCEGRKCTEVREVAVLRMVSSMALQEGVRSWHVWRQPMVIVTFVSVPLKDAQEGGFLIRIAVCTY